MTTTMTEMIISDHNINKLNTVPGPTKKFSIFEILKGMVVETNTPCFNQSSFGAPKPSTKLSMIVGLYGTKAIDF